MMKGEQFLIVGTKLCTKFGTQALEEEEKVETKVPKKHTCHVCGIQFDHAGTLDCHIESIHKNNMKYICPGCKKEFTQLSTFKKHIKKHKSKEIEDQVDSRLLNRCDICGAEFRYWHCLREHTAIEHDHSKPYQCEICQKDFIKFSNYINHMKLHQGEDRIPCPFCDQVFKTFEEMKSHRKQEHPKPHVCSICGESFKRKENLKTHELTHAKPKTERRQFKCTVDGCGASFTRKSNLKTHLKTIHGGTLPFSCQVCGKQFLYPSLLSNHMQSHEKTDVEVIEISEDFLNSPTEANEQETEETNEPKERNESKDNDIAVCNDTENSNHDVPSDPDQKDQ